MRTSALIDNMRQGVDSSWARRLLGVFEYVIAAIFVIQCNTVWMTIEPFRGSINTVLLIVLFDCTLCCMILSGAVFSKKRISVATAGVALVFLCLIGLIFVHRMNHSVFWHFLTCLLVLLLYYLMCCDGGVPAVLIKYGRIVTAVAGYSLVMWLFCSVLGLISPTGVVMTSWNDTAFLDAPINSYLGIYFETQSRAVFGTEMVRNSAIFTEGPMASLHFSLALLIEALLKEKSDKRVALLLTVAILSTMSTTGYLVILFVFLVKLVAYLGSKGWLTKRVLWVAVSVASVVGVAALAVILKEKLETVSGSIRFDDMRAGVLAFLDHPIVGNGFNNLPAIQRHMSSWRFYNVGFSSGLLWILSDGGLWLGLVHLLPMLWAAVAGVRQKDVGVSLFAASVFVIFLITVFQYSLLLSFILVFLANYQNPLLKKEKA